MIRRDCQHHLRYAGHDLCRLVWQRDAMAEPKRIEISCDPQDGRCPDYNPIAEKRAALPEAERGALEEAG